MNPSIPEFNLDLCGGVSDERRTKRAGAIVRRGTGVYHRVWACDSPPHLCHRTDLKNSASSFERMARRMNRLQAELSADEN